MRLPGPPTPDVKAPRGTEHWGHPSSRPARLPKPFGSTIRGAPTAPYPQVCNRGPTIVVIRDADGHVFGGHADEGWCTYAQRYKEAQAEAAAISRASRLGQEYDKKPTYKNQHRRFFGGDRSFIFSLFPEMHVYLASGANSNFLYYDVSEVRLVPFAIWDRGRAHQEYVAFFLVGFAV